MEEGITDKATRIREKAKIFLDKNIQAFIVDISNNYYFCNILSVDEISLEVIGFAGKRKFEKDRIFFIDILRFEKYEELEEKR